MRPRVALLVLALAVCAAAPGASANGAEKRRLGGLVGVEPDWR